MRIPQFKPLKSTRPYTDVVIIGIRTVFEDNGSGDGFEHETIKEHCIIHLKPWKGNLLRQDGPILAEGNCILESVFSQFLLGKRTLIVCNNSLVAVGSSDLGYMIDKEILKVSMGTVDKLDYGYIENEDEATLMFVASAPPTIIGLDRNNGMSSITIVDVANYGIKHLETIWDNISETERQRMESTAELGFSYDDPFTVASMMALFMQQYFQVCRTCKLGSPSLTYAGQAMKRFRRYDYSGEIQPHRNEEVAFLEESCYIGGRGEARYHGHYNGKVYLLDIQSLYPSQALDYDFPCELVSCEKSPSLETVKLWCEDYIVFAHVYVESNDGFIPKRTGVSTVFPVGTFSTYLCGDELRECLVSGKVLCVYFAARYRKKRILAGYSRHMLGARTVYKTSGQTLSEFILKCITNGLWGKFGQLGFRWIKDDEVCHDMQYGGFVLLDATNGKEVQYRVINGQAYRLQRAYWQDNTFIPIAAYANSTSRYLLWRYMQFAGISNVLYCSIDGLIVSENGYRNLSPFIATNANEYGKFKLAESASSCYIYKYGVYRIGNKTAYIGMPKTNRKTTVGFWNYKEDLLHPAINIETDTVRSVSYKSPIDIRMSLGENEKGMGTFTDPPCLEESPPVVGRTFYQRQNHGLPFVSWLE